MNCRNEKRELKMVIGGGGGYAMLPRRATTNCSQTEKKIVRPYHPEGPTASYTVSPQKMMNLLIVYNQITIFINSYYVTFVIIVLRYCPYSKKFIDLFKINSQDRKRLYK